MARWLAQQHDDGLERAYAEIERRRTDFLGLLLRYRGKLQQIYAEAAPASVLLERKRAVFDQLQTDYRQMRDVRWGGFRGYDRYFDQKLNNAHLAAIGAYYDLVPAFDAMLARDGSFPAFYAEVRRLAKLDKPQRDAALGLISGETSR